MAPVRPPRSPRSTVRKWTPRFGRELFQFSRSEAVGDFSIQWVGFRDDLISGAGRRNLPRAVQVSVNRELRSIREVVTEAYRQFAPEKDFGAHDPHGGVHLKDTIVTDIREALLSVRMADWGKYTTEPRRGYSRRGKPYKIVLPGGEVIFRQSVGEATTHIAGQAYVDVPGERRRYASSLVDYAAGRERMQWPLKAYKELQKQRVLETAGQVIAQTIAAYITRAASYNADGTISRQAAVSKRVTKRQARRAASPSSRQALSEATRSARKQVPKAARRYRSEHDSNRLTSLRAQQQRTQHNEKIRAKRRERVKEDLRTKGEREYEAKLRRDQEEVLAFIHNVRQVRPRRSHRRLTVAQRRYLTRFYTLRRIRDQADY